ncbi:MAG: protein-L-isoaspartate(D-aspartate) O-methyltransferase [Candidatus Solibacter sp.]|nr:protein-L-isoaspartate(D-aspartate) O-methyltransferase [Candidatus Solibacter sp.]
MYVPANVRCTAGVMFLVAIAAPLTGGSDPFALQREQMVRQIEDRGIRSPNTLRVMRATPRHLFLPPDLQARAYEDRPLPIGFDATISQPYIVALMTELLEPAKQHRVLEIGTGSGYQAAVLAQLVDHVFTIEIVPALAQSAQLTLRRLGYSNVTVRQGDGYRGWPAEAPFPRIILTASPPEIPQTLIDQLAHGGRLVAPVGRLGSQELVLIEKMANGTLRRRSVGPVAFVPMKPGGR